MHNRLANYFFDNNREIFDIFCEKFRIKNFDKWFLNLFSFLHQNYYNIFFFDLDDDNDLKLFFDYQRTTSNGKNSCRR